MNVESNMEFELTRRFEELMKDVPWISLEKTMEGDVGARGMVDYVAELQASKDRFLLVGLECKKSIRPYEVQALAQRLRNTLEDPSFRDSLQKNGFSMDEKLLHPVMAAPWISKRTAERIESEKIGWFDLAGNIHLSLPGVHIHQEGISNPFKPKKRDVKWSSEHVQRVIRELLEPSQMGKAWKQRELAERCVPSISLGMVNKVVKRLLEDAYAVEDERGLVVSDPEGLLHAWASEYKPIVQRVQKFHTTLHGQSLQKKLEDFFVQIHRNSDHSSEPLLLAGESAAKQYAPYLRSSTQYWYVMPKTEKMMVEALQLKEVEKGANMVLWVSSKPEPFRHSISKGKKIPTTSLIQTYLDTYSGGERGIEAAEHLLAHKIIPEWNQWRSTNPK